MPNTNVYTGWRNPDSTLHVTVNRRPLRHIHYHTQGTFDWGNESSGASDLALSILAHYFHERHVQEGYLRRQPANKPMPQCWQYHRAFMLEAVAKLPRTERWLISREQIGLWLERQAQ